MRTLVVASLHRHGCPATQIHTRHAHYSSDPEECGLRFHGMVEHTLNVCYRLSLCILKQPQSSLQACGADPEAELATAHGGMWSLYQQAILHSGQQHLRGRGAASTLLKREHMLDWNTCSSHMCPCTYMQAEGGVHDIHHATFKSLLNTHCC